MSQPPAPSPRAKKPSKNRQELVDAARRLMAEHGYAGAGTEAIVRSAGITRGALYYQFVDKTDLFRAVCEEVVRSIALRISDETMQRAQREEDELHIGAMLMVDCFGEAEVSRILLVDGPSVLGFEAWREVLQPVVMALLQHGLEHIVDAGQLEAASIEPLAHLLFGAIVQAAVAIGSAEEAEREAARQHYAQAISELIRGIGR